MSDAGTPLPETSAIATPKPILVHFDVIEIIAAHLARRNIDPAISKPLNGRRFCRKQNALNVARDFEIVIEPLLFVRLGVNDRVVKREGGLLGDRFENDEIALGKGRAHRAVPEREHAHVLLAVKQRRRP